MERVTQQMIDEAAAVHAKDELGEIQFANNPNAVLAISSSFEAGAKWATIWESDPVNNEYRLRLLEEAAGAIKYMENVIDHNDEDKLYPTLVTAIADWKNENPGEASLKIESLKKQHADTINHVSDALRLLVAIKGSDALYKKIVPINVALLKALGSYEAKEVQS
jgi:hypothetical protein